MFKSPLKKNRRLMEQDSQYPGPQQQQQNIQPRQQVPYPTNNTTPYRGNGDGDGYSYGTGSMIGTGNRGGSLSGGTHQTLLPPYRDTTPSSPIRSSFNSYGNNSNIRRYSGSPSQMSSASNAEQERKRITDKIIEDCYLKSTVVNGQKVHEIAYIAHIGVVEYTKSSAAPPHSDAERASYKKRILVLCKKQSGRVMLQKGRFLDERSLFQIGRDWDISELKSIRKVGSDGMTLQLNKDYYWKSDEEDSRIWKFCRYVCQEFGHSMGRYPALHGFSLDDFMLPNPPSTSSTSSPAQSNAPRFAPISPSANKAIGGGNAGGQPLRQTQTQTSSQQQEPKSKSLKQKILHKPSLFSSDKTLKHSSSSPKSPSNATFTPSSPKHKKTLSGGLYKNIDWTLQGQLPQKPMKVLERDRSANASTNTLEPTPVLNEPINTITSNASLKQAVSLSQNLLPNSRSEPTSTSNHQPQLQPRSTIDENSRFQDPYSRTTNQQPMQKQQQEQQFNQHNNKKPQHPYFQKTVDDAQSVMSNDSQNFHFGNPTSGENVRQSQERLSDYAKTNTMKPMETVSEQRQISEPLETKAAYNNQLYDQLSKGSQSKRFEKHGSTVSEKSVEEVLQEFGDSIPSPRKPKKIAASAMTPDFGIEEITDESDTDLRPGQTISIKKRQGLSNQHQQAEKLNSQETLSSQKGGHRKLNLQISIDRGVKNNLNSNINSNSNSNSNSNMSNINLNKRESDPMRSNQKLSLQVSLNSAQTGNRDYIDNNGYKRDGEFSKGHQKLNLQLSVDKLKADIERGNSSKNAFRRDTNHNDTIISSRYDETTINNNNNDDHQEKGLGISAPSFIGESTQIEAQGSSAMGNLTDLLDDHIVEFGRNEQDEPDLNEIEPTRSRQQHQHQQQQQKQKPQLERDDPNSYDNDPNALEEDPRIFEGYSKEPALNVSKKANSSLPVAASASTTTKNSENDFSNSNKRLVLIDTAFEKDPEVEELLKELGWNTKMNTEVLLKGLTKELNKAKRETVKRLVSVDLTKTLAQDVETASGEIDNMLRVFQRMDYNLKTLTNDVNAIDEKSKGLQLKFVNEKLLYNDLHEILSKVSINTSHLQEIGSFKEFSNLNRIEDLENKLSSLYNAIVTINADDPQNHKNENNDLSSLRALKEHQARFKTVNDRFLRHAFDFMSKRIDSIGARLVNEIDKLNLELFITALSLLLFYSGITYYMREVGATHFNMIKQQFNEIFAKVLDKMLVYKVNSLRASQKSQNKRRSNSNIFHSNFDNDQKSSHNTDNDKDYGNGNGNDNVNDHSVFKQNENHSGQSTPRGSRSRLSQSPAFHHTFDDLDDDDDEDDDDIMLLRKSRSTRFGRSGGRSGLGGAGGSGGNSGGRFGGLLSDGDFESKKQERLEMMKQQAMASYPKSSNDLDDSKAVVTFIDETRSVIMFLQFFIIEFFHYDVTTFDFNEFVQTNAFSQRQKMIRTALTKNFVELINGENGNMSISTDVMNNLNAMLAKYIDRFCRLVSPTDINKPVIIWQIEQMINSVQETYINQEFLIYNFMKKLSDQYLSLWKRYVDGLVESINGSVIAAKAGVLPSIKNIGYLLLITESSLDREVRGSATRAMIDQAYDKICEGLLHLFSREDPLMKGNMLDSKERETRGVAKLENNFFILQQVNDLSTSNNAATKRLLDSLRKLFKETESRYFDEQTYQGFGPLFEFINSHRENSRSSKSMKHAKSLLSKYTERDIQNLLGHILRNFEMQFRESSEHAPQSQKAIDRVLAKDLVDRLWLDLETVFIDYFTRLGKVLRQDYDRELEYNVGRQDIHHIFMSIREK